MVLGSYSNWGITDVPNVNLCEPICETKQAHDQLVAAGEQQDQHLQYYLDTFELPCNAFLDPYNFYIPESYVPPLLPYFSSPYETEPNIPYEDFNSYSLFPKRQKLMEAPCCSDFVPSFFDGVALNDSFALLPEEPSINRQIKWDHEISKKNSAEKCVSVQSIAARERRRKITERTQELGKLVPGGNKMNTAEMLQAAFNYIKFLQAQVGILQFMDSFLENEKANPKENMQIVTSSKIQEKLYLEDKCLVPKDFVLSLITISKPPLSDELSQLLAFAPQ